MGGGGEGVLIRGYVKASSVYHDRCLDFVTLGNVMMQAYSTGIRDDFGR